MKNFSDYFLGFDIGTNSVGWAVSDMQYKILKFNGKSMWGVHLFEDAETAVERKMFRSSRRRTQRVSQRKYLLRDIFREEIEKIDKNFFERLDDSKFYQEDKKQNQKNTLFNDIDFKDADYNKKYPTINHLRSELVHKSEPHDIRLVFLAINNIIKNRGHFLFENQGFSQAPNFENILSEFLNILKDYDIDFGILNSSFKEIENILTSKENRTSKLKNLEKIMINETDKEAKKQQKAIIKLIIGSKVQLSDIFLDDSMKDLEINDISFAKITDDKLLSLRDLLDEKMYIIEKAKSIYDYTILSDIIGNEQYISDAKIKIYDQHKEDLETLKKEIIKKYNLDANEILKSDKIKDNYCYYIVKNAKGSSENIGNLGKKDNKKSTQEDFCKFLKKKLENIEFEGEKERKLYEKICEYKAFPKQISKENSVIPYQLHLNELRQILKNAKNYLTFLSDKDEDGITNEEKILSIFKFKIPYYVGPLNSHSDFSWIQKNQHVKIYPWNFEKVVDLEESAEKFIIRMTNTCSYMNDEDVLAKNSILYSKFNILNQLNNIKIDGEKINIDLKKSIFNDLFLNIDKVKKITKKSLSLYISSKTGLEKDKFEITGIDDAIEGDMRAIVDFRKILKHDLDEEIIDDIVSKIVILGDSKDLLKSYLKKHYSLFDNEQINAISKLSYNGWGRLSRKLLTYITHTDKNTGEVKNIINAMYDTNNNLSQLLSNEYDYAENIKIENEKNRTKNTLNDMMENIYISPAVKRSITRVVAITKEIVKITKKQPKKIFIEVAREVDKKEKKKRTVSRKDSIKELYKNCKLEQSYLIDELEKLKIKLENEDDGKLRDNRLYLYYTQLGHCMYSGEKIDISEIFTKYDIDHIYPQSKVKDDSIDNRVLVKRELNARKTDIYPIPSDIITQKARELWKILKQKGIISPEKYNRLSRSEDNKFSDSELSGFIARQIVETRQSTKAVAHILEEFYKESEVVYVKAENVSDFRYSDKGVERLKYKKKEEYDIEKYNEITDKYRIVKSRLVNDYHHAKDAYLNIVVGNVYHEKFTKSPKNFIKTGQKYSMNKIFDYPVIKNNYIVWDTENDHSLKDVISQVEKNNILYTRYSTTSNGGFFDQNILKKGKGQYPIKTSDDRLKNIDKYGAYNSIKGAYFMLVEYTEISKKKEERVRIIEYVPIYLAKEIEKNPCILDNYLINTLGYKDPQILLRKIKMGSLFDVDGFKMNLSSRSEERLTFRNAQQLVLSKELYQYAVKIEKYIEKNRQEGNILPISEKYQKISKEKNIILYDELLNKLKNTVYSKKLSSQIDIFEKGKEKFVNLDIVKQCEFLYNSLKLFGNSPSGKDLSLIGGSKDAGILRISSKLKNSNKIEIINQSVTGLFERRVNLKICGVQ